MRSLSQQKGVTLVAVIFLIVVLGAAVTVLARLSAQSSAQTTQSLLQARAKQAAAAGIEWGVQTLVEGGDCGTLESSGSDLNVGAYPNVRVDLTCEANGPYNRNQQITLYRLAAQATYGEPDDADHVWAELNTTVEP